jgi:hypothetical protein
VQRRHLGTGLDVGKQPVVDEGGGELKIA